MLEKRNPPIELFQPILFRWLAVIVNTLARSQVGANLQVRIALPAFSKVHGVVLQQHRVGAPVAFLGRPFTHRELPLLRAGK